MDVRHIASAWPNLSASSKTCTGTFISRTTSCFPGRSRWSTGPRLPDEMTEEGVRDALRDVIDPELGVNIVDLGLVYRILIEGDAVHITMTMTSPACPLRDYLQDLVESAVT